MACSMDIDENLCKMTFMSTIQNLFKTKNSYRKKLTRLAQKDEEGKWAEKAIELIIHQKLKNRRSDLENLLYAISHQTCESKCVTISRSVDPKLKILKLKSLPHVIYCRLWRWADLRSHHEIRSVEGCKHPFFPQSKEVCINPYHYKRINTPSLRPIIVHKEPSFPSNLPPQAYLPHQVNVQQTLPQNMSPENPWTSQESHEYFCNFSPGPYLEALETSSESSNSPLASSPLKTESVTYHQTADLPILATNGHQAVHPPQTSMEPTMMISNEVSNNNSTKKSIYNMYTSPEGTAISYEEPKQWASIRYYELLNRIGEIYHCTQRVITVDGYTSPNRESDRFCLGSLSNIRRTAMTEKTMQSIGRGIQLHNVNGMIFLEVNSEKPVFVQSISCNISKNFHVDTVIKMPSGTSLKIFDNIYFSHLLEDNVNRGSFEEIYKLVKLCIIRVSFVKGWGANYHRFDATETPCWIEIHLNGPLKWLDSVLTTMGCPAGSIGSMT